MIGTVQTTPLTDGEKRDFYVALMQQAPLDLDPEKVRYYLAAKARLGADLRALLGQPVPAFDTDRWEHLFEVFFGRKLDLSNLYVSPKPDYSCWAVLIPAGLTNNEVFDACTKTFKSWRYVDDLNTVVDVVKRPEGPYVVWVRDTVEADSDMANKSAADIETVGVNTLTLKERMMLELVYLDMTSKHLDLENWTLCAGSRGAGGGVPVCRWFGGEFCVHGTCVDYRYSRLRARVAVS